MTWTVSNYLDVNFEYLKRFKQIFFEILDQKY